MGVHYRWWLVAAVTAGAAGLAAGARGATFPATRTEEPTMKKLTPILTVDAIEPCLPFWTERLGFAVTNQVPQGDGLGFAMLAKDGVEIMYQTHASVEADAAAVGALGAGTKSLLFIEVADVADVARRLDGAEVVVPMRKTFYGAEEIFVRAPCGTVVGFAQFGEQ